MNESASQESSQEAGLRIRFDSNSCIPEWIEELRRHVPDGQTVMASVRQDDQGNFQVNFRARLQRKSLVAIARAPLLQVAAQQAATVLKKQILRIQNPKRRNERRPAA
jgi:hypothetical protein